MVCFCSSFFSSSYLVPSFADVVLVLCPVLSLTSLC